MLILSLVVIAAVLARLEWVRRRHERQRAITHGWLHERGVSAERVTIGSSYGWPHYEVVFRSADEAARFRASPHYPELLRLVEALNASHRRSGRAFDPRLAVLVMPPPDTRATTGAA